MVAALAADAPLTPGEKGGAARYPSIVRALLDEDPPRSIEGSVQRGRRSPGRSAELVWPAQPPRSSSPGLSSEASPRGLRGRHRGGSSASGSRWQWAWSGSFSLWLLPLASKRMRWSAAVWRRWPDRSRGDRDLRSRVGVGRRDRLWQRAGPSEGDHVGYGDRVGRVGLIVIGLAAVLAVVGAVPAGSRKPQSRVA